MGMPRRLPAPASRPVDAGWSLLETVVSMSLMSVAGAIFTAGFVQVYRTFNLLQAQNDAQQQLTTAFLRLDREVQYASALSLPAKVDDNWYVEYLTGTGSTRTCVELRLNVAAGQLQRRSWTNSPPIAPTSWIPLASGVAPAVSGTGVTVAPFTLLRADPAFTFHRLQVVMASTSGTGATASTRRSVAIWSALNAGTDTNDSVCTDARHLG